MNLIGQKIVLGFSQAIAVSFTTLTLLNGINIAVQGQDIPQDVINGLFYPRSSQRFFEQGRSIFEREIQIFFYRQHLSLENILKTSDQLLQQNELLRQEEILHWQRLNILPPAEKSEVRRLED